MKATDEEVKAIVRRAKPLLEPAPERAARVREALRERLAMERATPPEAGGPPRGHFGFRRSTRVVIAVAMGVGLFALRPERNNHGESAPSSRSGPHVEEGGADRGGSRASREVATGDVIPMTAPPRVAAEVPRVAVESLPPVPPVAARALVPPPANPEKQRSSAHDRHENGEGETESLEREITLLREARLALGRGDGKSALRTLDRHAAEFPRGVLSEERNATRVIAFCALGREDDAQREARAFEQSSPHSPHIARLRQSCAHREDH